MRIVVADDSIFIREGVARLLAEAGFEVVGQAADGDGLLELVARFAPDVAIIDIRMPPDADGVSAPRGRSALVSRMWASWCCPSTHVPAMPSNS